MDFIYANVASILFSNVILLVNFAGELQKFYAVYEH